MTTNDDFPTDDLDKAFSAVWRMLGEGASDRRRVFHTPALVSVGLDGWPKARTVVLRSVDRENATLRCHTDLRSPKVAELEGNPRVGVLVYDPGQKLQVRLQGTATIDTSGEVADGAWASSTLWARRCYAAPLAPGTQTDAPFSNLTEALVARQPTEEEAEDGRGNFATITVEVIRIDWLYLLATGHSRALHVRDGAEWTHSWLAP